MSKFQGAWLYFKNDKIYFNNEEAMLKYLKDNPALEIESMSVTETMTKEEFEKAWGKLLCPTTNA